VRIPVRLAAEGTVESVAPAGLQSLQINAPAQEQSSLTDGSLGAVKEAAAAQSAQAAQLLTDLRESVTSTTKDVFESTESLLGKATDNASDVLETVSDVVSDFSRQTQFTLDSVKQQIDTFEHEASDGIQAAVRMIEESISVLKSQAIDAVPPEVKQYIELARPYVQSVSEFAAAYQTPLLIASAGLLGYVGFAFYTYRFVGYSGDILPENVLELLQSDAPALLVDIRSEDTQERDGIPKLRRKALGKAISVPFIQLDPVLRRRLNITKQLRSDITAAYIAGHRQAMPFTNFVILSKDGEQGRSVARSLRRLECPNAFVMLGGMAAWKESELPVSDSAVYDVTPIDVISNKALDITEPLTDPSNFVPVSVGAVAVGWTVWNYHYVLQLLGILGPSVGLVSYLLKKYDSPGELLDDLDGYLQKFRARPEAQVERRPEARTLTEARREIKPETGTSEATQTEIKPETGTAKGTRTEEKSEPSNAEFPSVESNEAVVADS